MIENSQAFLQSLRGAIFLSRRIVIGFNQIIDLYVHVMSPSFAAASGLFCIQVRRDGLLKGMGLQTHCCRQENESIHRSRGVVSLKCIQDMHMHVHTVDLTERKRSKLHWIESPRDGQGQGHARLKAHTRKRLTRSRRATSKIIRLFARCEGFGDQKLKE